MINKDILEKLAQYTKLDDSLIPDNSAVSMRSRYHNIPLPFKNENGTENWQLKNDIERSHEPKKINPTSPLKLRYPELSPEQIRYRGLNEFELARLRKDDDYKYERPNRYDYYSQNEEKTYGPHETDYKNNWATNSLLPEDNKKRVVDKYNKLRAAATEFQLKYNEANALAAQNIELDYSGSYIDLFKNFGKFIVANVHRYLGVLFGVLPELGRRERYNSRAINIAKFINDGINLFNITPLNIETKLHEMSSAIFTMRAIIDEYERRKKVLKKLSLVEVDVKRYLMKKEKIEFLKWMDMYFPNDKKEFMEGAVKEVLDENGYTGGFEFKVGNLKKIKVYSDIYNKASDSGTTKLYLSMENRVMNDIRERLNEELKVRIVPKIAAFKAVIDAATQIEPYNVDLIVKYVYKNYRLDLKSILNYVQLSFERYYKDRTNDTAQFQNTVIEGRNPEEANEDANKNFAHFKQAFVVDLNGLLDGFKEDGWQLKNYIEELSKNITAKMFTGKTKEGRDMLQLQHKMLDQLTTKDIDEMVVRFFRDVIIDKLPNFQKPRGYGGYNYVFPGFAGIGRILKETGKFSIDSILNNIHSKVPFVPKEFLLNLVRSLFKNQIPVKDTIGEPHALDRVFDDLSYLQGTSPATAMKVFLDLLKRSNKFNPNSFTNEFVKSFPKINNLVGTFIAEQEYSCQRENRKKKFSEADTIQLFSVALRNIDTVDRDEGNLRMFIKYIHDNAEELDKSSMLKLIQNKSFHQYSKTGIVRKLFNIYSLVKALGGLQGIYKKYGDAIKSLKAEGFVSKGFDANIRFVIRVFNSGEQISPASQYFKKMFDITSTLETDLETIEEGEALSTMLKDYQKKDERLFRLDLQINDRLRFRVLKDKDPRMLRMGVESNCCQRVGGAGEAAARDSFINPLAGVVILEWKNEEGEYVLLTQSYFHFVPKDNSYILDNIEKDGSNVRDSEVDLSAAYAYLAQKTNEKWNVGYFLAGKGYSKVHTGDFKTKKLRGGDPRFFDRRSGSPYSDFESSNAMDLLTPKFDLGKKLNDLTQESKDIKEAFEVRIWQIIKNGIAA
jgi:hypothetical protein